MSVHNVLYIVFVLKLTLTFSCDLGSLESMSGLVSLSEVSQPLVCDTAYWLSFGSQCAEYSKNTHTSQV